MKRLTHPTFTYWKHWLADIGWAGLAIFVSGMSACTIVFVCTGGSAI